MSVNIFHKTGSGTGTLQKVAGNTVILDATTSEKRDWTVTIPCTTNTYCTGTVTFDVPMPDTDYCVLIETCNHQEAFEKGWTITNKTVNGFTLQIYASAAVNATFTGYAFKLITMDGYTELQNKVENPDNMPTKDSNNLVKSGGVWEALKDAGTVFTGTKAEWENLDPTEQERYEVVCITDDEESGGGESYSTDEVNTGKTWIDGKPIYRKVTIGTVNTYTDAGNRRGFPLLITSNVDTLISYAGFWEVIMSTGINSYGFPLGDTGIGGDLTVQYSSIVQKDQSNNVNAAPQVNINWYGITSVKITCCVEYTKAN